MTSVPSFLARITCIVSVFVALLGWADRDALADCSLTRVGITPLSDAAALRYKGEAGGLYPGGRSTRPVEHEAAGIAIAEAIVPLDGDGDPDPSSGHIAMITLGMSNARTESNRFIDDANDDPAMNDQLVIVNGAQDSQTADVWADVDAHVWREVDSRLASHGLTPNQVQVAWFKNTRPQPATLGEFPTHAQALAANFEQVARNLKTHFPNVKLAYLSSRTRAYTTGGTELEDLSPEPYAFESGFSVRWAIEEQLTGAADLNFDPRVGTVVAPHLNWGPYLWADGTTGRSDGLQWNCNDVISADFIHPSGRGNAKVSEMLLAFFKTDATAAPWFLEPDVVGAAPSCSIAARVESETAPTPVTFDATTGDSDGSIVDHAWTFGDGTFSVDASPDKRFHADDDYPVRLTVTDDDGNPTTCEQLVTVPEPSPHALGVAALTTIAWWRRRAIQRSDSAT